MTWLLVYRRLVGDHDLRSSRLSLQEEVLERSARLHTFTTSPAYCFTHPTHRSRYPVSQVFPSGTCKDRKQNLQALVDVDFSLCWTTGLDPLQSSYGWQPG